MGHIRHAPWACAAILVLQAVSLGQTANGSISLTSLATGQLSAPQMPAVTPHCTGSCGSSWQYEVWAVDEANGTTLPTFSNTVLNATSLDATHYNTISTAVVSGAQSCTLYRSTVPSSSMQQVGQIGTGACGSTINDTGLSTVSGNLPTVNTTGSVSLSGNLAVANIATASSFVANGGAFAGGDTFVAGTAAGAVQGNSVTIEAPLTVTGSGLQNAYVMILPQDPPAANGVMLYTAGAGTTFKTTHATFGTLTNPSSTALVTTSGSAIPNGDLVSATNSSGAVDLADSAISVANGTITKYANQTTYNFGVATDLGTLDLTGKTGNIVATTLLNAPSAATYRVSIYIAVTTTAGTSSTMPDVCVLWTERDNSTSLQILGSTHSSGNNLSTFGQVSFFIDAKQGTNIQVATGTNCGGTGYASVPTLSMQYKVRARAEGI